MSVLVKGHIILQVLKFANCQFCYFTIELRFYVQNLQFFFNKNSIRNLRHTEKRITHFKNGHCNGNFSHLLKNLYVSNERVC